MSLNRRQVLKLLASGVIGSISSAELDIDRLLWIPGEKTIFIPRNPTLSLAQIVAIEWERILQAEIHLLFERNDTFYKILSK